MSKLKDLMIDLTDNVTPAEMRFLVRLANGEKVPVKEKAKDVRLLRLVRLGYISVGRDMTWKLDPKLEILKGYNEDTEHREHDESLNEDSNASLGVGDHVCFRDNLKTIGEEVAGVVVRITDTGDVVVESADSDIVVIDENCITEVNGQRLDESAEQELKSLLDKLQPAFWYWSGAAYREQYDLYKKIQKLREKVGDKTYKKLWNANVKAKIAPNSQDEFLIK